MNDTRVQPPGAMSARELNSGAPPSPVAVHTPSQQKGKVVSLFGGFGLGNLGNEITLQAILFHFRKRFPDVTLNCICTHPEITAANHQIATLPVTPSLIGAWRPRNRLARILRSTVIGIPNELYRWLGAFKSLTRTSALIVPGTGLLTDAYGLTGWGPYNSFKWSLMAKMRGCKLVYVSVGAGPIHSWIGKWLVRSALALADFRSYRDNETKAFLNSIGAARKTDRVFPDLAFSIVDEIRPKPEMQNRPRPVIGLGLMLYHGKLSSDEARESTYKAYLEHFVVFVKWLLARGYDVRLLIGEGSDIAVTAEFNNLLKSRLDPHDAERVIDEPASSVEELLAQLSETTAVVATRFHNILLALALNKPTICVSFHQKCTSLMQDMGLAEYCQDIKKLDSAKFIEQFCRLEQNSESLKPMIRAKVEDCRRALDEQYDLIFKDLLAE